MLLLLVSKVKLFHSRGFCSSVLSANSSTESVKGSSLDNNSNRFGQDWWFLDQVGRSNAKLNSIYTYRLNLSQRYILHAYPGSRYVKFRLKKKFSLRRVKVKNYKLRPALVDPIYQSKRINSLLKLRMRCGERRVVERFVYRYLFELHNNKKMRVLLFLKFLSQLLVPMALNRVRVGGRIYDVPFYTWWHRRLFFGYDLLLTSRNANKTDSFNKRLLKTTRAFLAERHGGLVGRRLRVIYRKLAKSRGYLHYRWY